MKFDVSEVFCDLVSYVMSSLTNVQGRAERTKYAVNNITRSKRVSDMVMGVCDWRGRGRCDTCLSCFFCKLRDM